MFYGEILVACFVSGTGGTEEIHVPHFNSSCTPVLLEVLLQCRQKDPMWAAPRKSSLDSGAGPGRHCFFGQSSLGAIF